MENDPFTQGVTSETAEATSCFFTDNLLAFILVGILLLIVSGLVSGSKVAFLSIGAQQRRILGKSKRLTSRAVQKLLDRIEDFLALISVLNSFNYLAIAFIWLHVTSPLLDFMSPILRCVIQLVVLVPILLVFCEVFPKMVAKQMPTIIIYTMAVPMLILGYVLKPITFVVGRSNRGIERQVHKSQSMSVDELSDAIEEPSSELMPEREMLKGIIEFGNIEVSEIMCPRVDMFAIESKEPFEQVLKKITASGYSRIPIYAGTYDQISGILYIKDLLPYVNNKNGFNWQSLIRPPHFVPENKKINELFEELQLQKKHMAIVVDEYGGTSGLVTMEDIIEMIVGDISDEFDDDESDFTKLDEHTYLFKGNTLLSDFCEYMNLESDAFAEIQGDSESLAGLILEMKGELPRKNERFEFGDFEFLVEEVAKRRITSIVVRHKNQPKDDGIG